jgi:hypothetical protein
MIALKVSVNKKQICLAGAEDLCVLNTMITATGILGNKTVAKGKAKGRHIYYGVGGLTSRKDSRKNVHINWKDISKLKVGDVVQVEVIEVDKADRPKGRKTLAHTIVR